MFDKKMHTQPDAHALYQSRHRIVRAVSQACLVMALGHVVAPHVYAAEPTAVDTSRKQYTISAGPLDKALATFAAEAGVTVSFVPELIAGNRNSGLNGNYAAQEGLHQLLNGSGLEAVSQGNRIFVLRKIISSPSSESILPAISVTTSLGATTEGSGSYTTGAMTTATRFNLSMRDTPQSISVVSRQRMDDQNITSLNDVVKNVTGLSVMANGVSADDTRYHARGFEVDNLMIDGVPISFGFNSAASMPASDMIMYDRIEVVRGAPGLTVGAGNPSATINMVRKRPVAEPLFNVSARVGSWGRTALSIDASRALNESGSLRARVAGSWQDRDSFIDVVNMKNQTLYGIIEADIAPRTTISLGASDQKNNTSGVALGLPTNRDGTFHPFDRSTFYGSRWSYSDRSNNSAFTDLVHQFDNEWTGKVALVSTRSRSESLYPHWWQTPNWTAPFAINQVFGGRYASDDLNADAHLTGPLMLAGRRHELMVGVTQRRNESATRSYSGLLSSPGSMSMYDPSGLQNVPLPGSLTLSNPNTSISTQKAIYGAGHFNLTDRLKTIIGGRLNWYDYRSSNANPYKINREFTPYAAATFAIDKAHSIYTSYTRIFQPQSAVDASGNVLDPLTGTNLEAGIKGEYFGGALNSSFAVFNIKQQNRPMQDTEGPSPCPSTGAVLCNRAAGEVESKGYELELSGEVQPGWQMSAAYTYVSIRYTKDQLASNVGKIFNTRLPKRQLKFSTSYRLPGDLNQWTIGGSVYSQDTTYNESTTSRIEQKTYAIAGLMAGYKINKNTNIQLNIENLFDKHYYEALGYVRGGYGSNNWYGAPRNFMLTLNYRM